MAKVVYAIHSTNPWFPHLGTLSQHLGFGSYYVIPVDQLNLAQTLARLPEDVKLILITATSTTQPTQLEDFKGAVGYGSRSVENLVNIPERKFDVSSDIHRHILSFLSGKEVAPLSEVSRQWRKATGVSSDWRLWHQLARQDFESKIDLEEFKKLGRTPVEAYVNADEVEVYINALRKQVRKDPESIYELGRDPIFWDTSERFVFRITIPTFARIYEAITSLLKREERTKASKLVMRDLVMNLGRTGSAEDIIEFLSFVLIFDPPYLDNEGEAVNQWIAKNPTIRKPLRPFLMKEGSYIRSYFLDNLLGGMYDSRREVATAIYEWARNSGDEEFAERIDDAMR